MPKTKSIPWNHPAYKKWRDEIANCDKLRSKKTTTPAAYTKAADKRRKAYQALTRLRSS